MVFAEKPRLSFSKTGVREKELVLSRQIFREARFLKLRSQVNVQSLEAEKPSLCSEKQGLEAKKKSLCSEKQGLEDENP